MLVASKDLTAEAKVMIYPGSRKFFPNEMLLDKVNVCFKQGQYVQLKEIPAFKLLIKNKGVSKKTVVFDNMINTKFEFDGSWEVPAGESWLSHFF